MNQNNIQLVSSSSHRAHQEPEFLHERVAAFEARNATALKVRNLPPEGEGVHLISNDFLALSRHPRILEAQARALMSTGHGAMMSPLFMHESDPQCALEERFADYLGVEAVAITQSGWGANFGLLKGITGPDVPVYLDRLCHSSLWEGVNASGARGRPFRHNDMVHLRDLITRHGSGVIVVDSLYSTTGSIAPLGELTDIAEETGCVLVVDEAHSIGTYGPNGEGMVAGRDLSRDVHFITGSLAKAFVGRAGFVAGSRRNIDFFRFNAGPFLFSSKLLPPEVAALEAAMDVIIEEDWRRRAVVQSAHALRRGLIDLGYRVKPGDAHIVSVASGELEHTLKLRDLLAEQGVFAAIFGAPATPRNDTLLRMTVHADLTDADISHALSAFADLAHRGLVDESLERAPAVESRAVA